MRIDAWLSKYINISYLEPNHLIGFLNHSIGLSLCCKMINHILLRELQLTFLEEPFAQNSFNAC